MPPTSLDVAGQALVDVHVHFHPGFDELRFFRSAAANFSVAAGAMGIRDPWIPVMVLADGEGGRAFQRFRERVASVPEGPLVFEATDEAGSLAVRIIGSEGRQTGKSDGIRYEGGFEERHEVKGGVVAREGRGGVRIILVAGSQIQTAEGLEVLAFPAPLSHPQGLSLEDTITRTVAMGAVAILPWGFGKWTFGRGALVSSILRERRPRDFLLADTCHRPSLAPCPRLLRQGEAASVPVLVGSDPLPLPGEDRRPGSCCFALDAPGVDRTPGLSLKLALEGLKGSPPRFARPRGIASFLVTQVAMQVMKRLDRPRA